MKRLFVMVAALLLVVSPLFADRIVVGNGGEELEVRVLESSDQGVTLEIEIGSFDRTAVIINGETYYSVTLGEESNLMEAGLPDMPNICRTLLIPDDAKMAISILSSEFEEIVDFPVAPSKGHILRNVDPATVPYSFDPFYGEDRWFPRVLADLRDPFIIRDFRGVVEELNPFQYNPATRTLRVFTRIVVEIVPTGPGEINVLTRHHRDSMNSEFFKIYENLFLNFESSRYNPVGEVGEMLIITYDAFHGMMQPLADWKNQMGMKTTIVDVSTIPNSWSAINAYIENYYNTHNLAYVLLIGDAAQVAYPSSAGGAADPVYALISADHYPEFFVGRFSATTATHVQTQVERTITYERDPAGGGDWYHKGMGVASNQGPGDDGEYDNQHMNNIRADLLGFTYTEVDQIYDPSASAGQVSAALNTGRSFINYTGHGSATSWGSSGFSNSHVNTLVNNNMLPFIVSVACVNGQFTAGTCFAETWMRAMNGSTPTGAIATYMSSINQSWNSPMCGQDEMTDLLVAGEKRTFGGICYNGSCQMIQEYGGDGQNMFDTWLIFGDPSLRVRTDTPADLTVSHDATLDESAVSFAVSVPGVEGALCGLSYNGGYHGSAFTDAGGNAVITVEGALPAGEEMTLTVTGFNKTPYIAAVPVGPGVDAIPSTVAGNTDLMICPNGLGDSIMVLTVTVKNGNGEPISGIPAGDIVFDAMGVSSSGRGFHFCASGSDNAQFLSVNPTDAEGKTTIEVSEMGGCGAVTVTAMVNGTLLDSRALVNVRSPDFNGDGTVNFLDVFAYLPELNAGNGKCGNLNFDAQGDVNFSDTAKLLSHLAVQAQCP